MNEATEGLRFKCRFFHNKVWEKKAVDRVDSTLKVFSHLLKKLIPCLLLLLLMSFPFGCFSSHGSSLILLYPLQRLWVKRNTHLNLSLFTPELLILFYVWEEGSPKMTGSRSKDCSSRLWLTQGLSFMHSKKKGLKERRSLKNLKAKVETSSFIFLLKPLSISITQSCLSFTVQEKR